MTTPINKILTNHKQTLSIDELANVSASLSAILGQGGGGGGGEPCASAWLPSVDENGNLSWTLSMSTTTPASANIMGPQGPSGTSGAKGEDGTSIILQSVTDVAGGKQVTLAWGETPSTSSFVIPSGASGTNGTNGFSPTVTITDAPTTEHPQGGKTVTITDADHPAGQSFDIWNGIDGQGATVNLIEGDGIQITHEASTTNYTIGVSADYALKSELPDVTDMATKTWVGDQGFLKNTDLTDYALKTYVDTASAEALSQAKSWTNQQNFATSAGLDADKLFAMTRTGWSDFTIPSTSGYLPLSGGTVSGQLTISGSGFNNNLHLKRSNYEGFVGLANNGAVTIKNVIPNSTSQIEFLTSANKTFDITVKDNSTTPQPVGKLYVMSAHSLADASATSANWVNDGMLHIILDS